MSQLGHDPSLPNRLFLPFGNLFSSPPSSSSGRRRLFNRQQSLYHLLGNGTFADIILWRKKHLSAAILAGASGVWIYFDWFGCHVVPFVSLTLLIVTSVLFLWSNAAAFVNRSAPRLPKWQLSEETVIHVAANMNEGINRLIALFREIALGEDIKLFLVVQLSLWIVSVVAGWFDFLTLAYIGIIFALIVPALYERYEDTIDHCVQSALEELHKIYLKSHQNAVNQIPELRKLYEKSREMIISKIPGGIGKAKKTQ